MFEQRVSVRHCFIFYMCLSIQELHEYIWSVQEIIGLVWSRWHTQWFRGLLRSENDSVRHLKDRRIRSTKVVLE